MSWLGDKWGKAKDLASGAAGAVEHGAEAVVGEGEHLASEAEDGIVDTARDAYHAVEAGAGNLAAEAGGESDAGEEGSGVGKTLEKGLGWATDALEIGENVGVEAAEDLPLLGSAVHGVLGAAHTVNMVSAHHDEEKWGQEAATPEWTDEYDQGDPSAIQLHQMYKQRDRMEHEGEEAKDQFIEAIPLVGLASTLFGASKAE